MHISVYEFNKRCIPIYWPNDKAILEVGSFNVNGSIRPDVEKHNPVCYIGTDMRPGPMVDVVVNICDLVPEFGVARFDVVLCTEVMEHVEDWAEGISQMLEVLKPNGYLMITTRSAGFPKHDFPNDYWRYTKEDMQAIFATQEIVILEDDYDPASPGVFVLVKKTGPVEDISHLTIASVE